MAKTGGLCRICGEGHLTVQVEKNPVEYKGVSEELDSYYSVCDACGSEQADAAQTRVNKRLMIAFKKQVDGLLVGAGVRDLTNNDRINRRRSRPMEGRSLNDEKLHEILNSHAAWLRGESSGQRANLMDADLRRTNLMGANLRGVAGNGREIKSIFVSEQYPITYTAEYMQIGCERHLITEWWEFDDKRISEMGGVGALKFWREWKDSIRVIIEKSPAVKCDVQ